MGRRPVKDYPKVIQYNYKIPLSTPLHGCRVIMYKNAPAKDIRFIQPEGLCGRGTFPSIWDESTLNAKVSCGQYIVVTDPDLRKQAIEAALTWPRHENP